MTIILTVRLRRACALALLLVLTTASAHAQPRSTSYDDLVQLFHDWRELESPPLLEGAPDYTAERFERTYAELPDYRARLNAIDVTGWPVEQQVDWHVVNAEMNGFDFNHRVLKPWVRDPAFYQSIWTAKSDVPAHEGPTHHAVLELWTYDFPLSDEEQARMLRELRVIPPLMRQARRNLTGNARDLWIAGTRNIRRQRVVLEDMKTMVSGSASPALAEATRQAQTATDELVDWLESEVVGQFDFDGPRRP